MPSCGCGGALSDPQRLCEVIRFSAQHDAVNFGWAHSHGPFKDEVYHPALATQRTNFYLIFYESFVHQNPELILMRHLIYTVMAHVNILVTIEPLLEMAMSVGHSTSMAGSRLHLVHYMISVL